LPLVIDESKPPPPHTLPSRARVLKVLGVGLALWLAPLALLYWQLGVGGIHAQEYFYFTKAAFVTFGGAYAAIPFLRDDAVGRGWLSEAQFLDGVAIAGALPAPLIIFATFVGWAAGGAPGALLMTAGVFLPAFAFSLLLFERIEALAEARRLRLFLGGVTAAVVGLIAAATFDLGEALLARTPSLPVGALIFALALLALYGWRSRASVPLTVLGGGGAGALLFG